MAANHTLLGNVINAAIAAAGYRAQIEATDKLISLQQEQVNLTASQVKAGLTPIPTR